MLLRKLSSILLILLAVLVYAENEKEIVIGSTKNHRESNKSISGRISMLDIETSHAAIVVDLLLNNQVIKTLTTDDDGRFNFYNLPAGNYQIRCYTPQGYKYLKNSLGVKTFSYLDKAISLNFILPPICRGNWVKYTNYEGLPVDNIFSLLQDDEGKLWIATLGGGVAVFDGVVFTTFNLADGLENLIAVKLFINSKRELWVGTAWGGVSRSRRDGETKFETLTIDDGLGHGGIHAISELPNGQMVFGSFHGGLSFFDGTKIIQTQTDEDGLIDKEIRATFCDNQGRLWVFTQSGCCVYEEGRFRRVGVNLQVGGSSQPAIQTADNNIWFATENGAFCYTGGDYRNKDNYTLLTINNGLLSNQLSSVFQSKDGRIWFGCQFGVSCYDGNGVINYTHLNSGLPNAKVWSINQTSDGYLWFATAKGLVKYDENSIWLLDQRSGMVSNEVVSIRPKLENLLVGTRVGLSELIFHQDIAQFAHFKTIRSQVNCIIADHDKFWVGTETGLFSITGSTAKEIHIGLNVTSLALNQSGNLYVGTNVGFTEEAKNSAVWLLNQENLELFEFPTKLRAKHIPLIFQSANQKMWFGTRDPWSSVKDALWLLQHEKVEVFKRGVLPEAGMLSAKETENGNIYFGSRAGLILFQNGNFQSFGPIRSQVNDILRENNYRYWFATSKGVYLLDQKDNIWSKVNSNDGLPDNNIHAVTKDIQGSIWLATSKGLVRYRQNHSIPNVKFQRIQYETQPLTDFRDKLQVEIKKRITVEFSSIDFKTLPNRSQYQVRRIGKSGSVSSWKTIVGNQYNFSFEDDGIYKLEARSVDRDLNFSEPASVAFEAVQPWFFNAWIVIPVGVVILGVVILAIVNGARYYHQRRESDRLELEAQQLQVQMLEQEREIRLALEAELTEAHDMQVVLLPESAPKVSGLQIAGRNIAAKEVGGDFFDYLENSEQLTIAVGDVSGKGLKGAMNAVMVSGILNLSAKHQDTVSELMSEINTSLCQSMEQDMNVTMVLAQFDLQGKQMTLANAGQHAYPLLKRATSVRPVKARGLALGLIPSILYKPLTIDLQPDDLLLFMTDGITEPRNGEGLMYEESGRFHELILELSDQLSAEEVVETIIQDVINYMVDEEERDDDITLVAVKVT